MLTKTSAEKYGSYDHELIEVFANDEMERSIFMSDHSEDDEAYKGTIRM